jgi:hypothetical protein
MVSFTPWPLYSRGKSHQHPLGRKLGSPSDSLDTVEKREIFFPCRDSNINSAQSVAWGYISVEDIPMDGTSLISHDYSATTAINVAARSQSCISIWWQLHFAISITLPLWHVGRKGAKWTKGKAPVSRIARSISYRGICWTAFLVQDYQMKFSRISSWRN